MHRLRRKLPNDLIMHIIKLADGGKYTHKVKMKPVLESIKQTGGWYGWHRERDTLDGEWCPAIYGLVDSNNEYHFSGREDYAGIQWGELFDESTPYWIDELFDAEYDNHSEIVVGRDISADEYSALMPAPTITSNTITNIDGSTTTTTTYTYH